jgi:hypothetical protein
VFVLIVVPPTWKVPCVEVIVVFAAGVVLNVYVTPWDVVTVFGALYEEGETLPLTLKVETVIE